MQSCVIYGSEMTKNKAINLTIAQNSVYQLKIHIFTNCHLYFLDSDELNLV